MRPLSYSPDGPITPSSIQALLFTWQDQDYKAFQSKLIPTVDPGRIIGVRTPDLRSIAGEIRGREGVHEFLESLPHRFFEENQLHVFLLSLERDLDACIDSVDRFLPYIDNWATCDQLSPKVFRKNRKALLSHIDLWLKSSETYTVRFGVKMLMEHFLEDDFKVEYPVRVSQIVSDEYYVNMMIAWYFATALAKQYETVLPFISEHKLPAWTHNKAIQKSLESYRISDEHKALLRSFKDK